MKTIRYPEKAIWKEILARPVFETKSLERHVQNILNFVKKDGDEAVRHFTKTLDKVARFLLTVCAKSKPLCFPKPCLFPEKILTRS